MELWIKFIMKRKMMNKDYITVTQLTKYIKYKIDNDPNLNTVFLKGEISNFKEHSRGHLYFTIKDENTRINAIMFSSHASKVNFKLTDGMKVLVVGKISVYEATGNYQIYVEQIEEDGLGNLYIKFEELKKKLETEGLFDDKYKKPIPKIPKRIGIITASTGAAIKDILSTLKRRWPIVETILFPSLVQGALAAEDIVRNIELSKEYDLDLLIVGRGGGSIEDLWPFNEEIVARAIFRLEVPVISAVGHEIDFTIADFVADLRAPTPTGAAEMAVPDIKEVFQHLNQVEIRGINIMNNILNSRREYYLSISDKYILKNPLTIYQIKGDKFDVLFERSINVFKNILSKNKNTLDLIEHKILNEIKSTYKTNKHDFVNVISKLEVLNPLLTIKRGYSIIRKEGNIISNSKGIKKKDIIDIELRDGNIKAEVI